MNERYRRLLAAAEAQTAGYGGIAAESGATGAARPLNGKDPALRENPRQPVEPATTGDPVRPPMWVSKCLAKLAAALCEMGRKIADSCVPKLLGLLDYRQ